MKRNSNSERKEQVLCTLIAYRNSQKLCSRNLYARVRRTHGMCVQGYLAGTNKVSIQGSLTATPLNKGIFKNPQDLCREILFGGTYEKDPEKELTGSLCKDFRTRMLFRGACRISLRGSLERIRRISVHKSSSNSKIFVQLFWRNSPDLNCPPPVPAAVLETLRMLPGTDSHQLVLHLQNRSKRRANSQFGL